MTSEEKAKELIEKFHKHASALSRSGQELTPNDKWNNAKACAIICVDEIIDFMQQDDLKNKDCHWANSSEVVRWHKIKQIINQ